MLVGYLAREGLITSRGSH